MTWIERDCPTFPSGVMEKLARSFYDRDTILVARGLLGKFLVHVSDGVERIGRIVETEAYLGPHDLAAHSARGLTRRTQVMFGPPGHAYVYLIYGMYYCMNVVTEREGHASAVLLRQRQPQSNAPSPNSANTLGSGIPTVKGVGTNVRTRNTVGWIRHSQRRVDRDRR